MYNKKEINKKVEELREELQKLIAEKDDLLDEEVIVASKNLDDALNEYHALLRK